MYQYVLSYQHLVAVVVVVFGVIVVLVAVHPLRSPSFGQIVAFAMGDMVVCGQQKSKTQTSCVISDVRAWLAQLLCTIYLYISEDRQPRQMSNVIFNNHSIDKPRTVAQACDRIRGPSL